MHNTIPRGTGGIAVEISARWVEEQWGIANAEGTTTAVCEDNDTPMQAARRLGLQHILTITEHNGGIVAGLTKQGRLLVIGVNNGPMACYIPGICVPDWLESGTLVG
jgi:hypothetical protein